MGDDINNGDVCAETPLTSNAYEQQMQAEFNRNKPVTEFRPSLSARSIVIPATDTYSERHIVMTDTSNPVKDVLYRLVVAAINYAFFDKFSPKTAMDSITCSVPNFIAWLNDVEIKNRYEVLKQYETHRFDVLNNHGGESALKRIKALFSYALDYSVDLHKHLTQNELSYLQDIRKTKISPNINKTQKSLSSYFGGLDWLRRDDIGIGNKLYSALASPKLTVSSLSLTASTIIIEFEKLKRELRYFFYDNGYKGASFLSPLNFNKLTKTEKINFIGNTLYQLLSTYHEIEELKPTLRSALEMVILSNIKSEQAFIVVKTALDSQSQCDAIFLNKVRNKTTVNTAFCAYHFSGQYSGALLGVDHLYHIAQDGINYPITKIEGYMFSWLMASLTVQPYDIPKLKHASFRLLKVGGKVKHIECEYFKGRAKVFHTTRSLSTSNCEGQAVLTYLSQQTGMELTIEKFNFRIFNGITSFTGKLAFLLKTDVIQESLTKQHKRQDNLPLIIPNALISLIQHGTNNSNVVENTKNYPIDERKKGVQASGTACPSILFGLQAIKNSAVHAFSDPYTLHYLINRNSHTNQTEKENYLNGDSEEWMNSAGRITREVMLDLINNVFNLGFKDLNSKKKDKAVERFNSEFMAVTENISYRKEEMLARLKVITEQNKGKVNEVGVLALDDKDDAELFSPLYVVDSPVTAWRMNNYLHEFKKSYKKLLAQNPDYLYKTVMPTAEWTEYALTQLSKENQKTGREMFKEMLKNGSVVSVFHSI